MFAKQNDLSAIVYHDLMIDNIDEVTDMRLKALKEIEKDKVRATKTYNKKVKSKSFQVGELVLPIRTKSNQFGKWSPN
jgi:Na+-transporting NADH:ubiquinone oxidoreductase subunit NqrC